MPKVSADTDTAPRFVSFPLATYAENGELCADTAGEERLFMALWHEWRTLGTSDVPRVLLLDFASVRRVEYRTAAECLVAFVSMIVGLDRPYYAVCWNLEQTVRDSLETVFASSNVVVATASPIPDGRLGYGIMGDKTKRQAYKVAWDKLLHDAFKRREGTLWLAGRTFERANSLRTPPAVLEEMYEHGIVIKDGNRPVYRVVFPLSARDAVEMLTMPR